MDEIIVLCKGSPKYVTILNCCKCLSLLIVPDSKSVVYTQIKTSIQGNLTEIEVREFFCPVCKKTTIENPSRPTRNYFRIEEDLAIFYLTRKNPWLLTTESPV